ncbi:MAG: hypothetical protein LAT79_18870 [Kiritimatiellae bacterium]|nr:hypothetical protein [Kiritimatiellia bacterium]
MRKIEIVGDRFSEGLLVIESDASLGASSGTLTLDNASLVLLGNVSGTRELQIGGGGGTVEASGGSGHFSGPLSGSGELSLNGPHPITLAGNNAGFTGTIEVSDGTLRTEGGNVFAPGISVHLSSGANLQVMDAETGASLSGSGTVLLHANLALADNSVAPAFSGDLSISNGTLVLLNDGQAELTGDTVLDNGELNAGQGLRLASGASLTALSPSSVRGDMTNDGAVHVSSGSTLVFNDNVDGSGNYTGTGNVQFNQTFSPGNSPGDISFEGDMTLQDTATLLMELGGQEPGAEFDFLQIGGTATLGGQLQIALLDDFSPSIGDEFLVATWSNFTGQFSNSQPLQVEEHEFDVRLSDEGMTLVAIPEPATWALVSAPR